MEIKLNRRIQQEINNADSIRIVLNEEIQFEFSIISDELIIRKINYGDGDSSINIKPNVSNVISIK